MIFLLILFQKNQLKYLINMTLFLKQNLIFYVNYKIVNENNCFFKFFVLFYHSIFVYNNIFCFFIAFLLMVKMENKIKL